jgi:DNA polymerase I
MQANGAEMLRLACIRMAQEGIRICAPVHDAILIEAPLEQLAGDVAKAQDIMRRASAIVLGGFQLGNDAKVICYPDRYSDKRGEVMWVTVMRLLAEV